MAKTKRLVAFLREWEPLAAWSDRLGISAVIRWIGAFILAGIFVVALWMWANLEWWAITLVGMAFLVLVLGGIKYLTGIVADVATARGITPIDRSALAAEAEKLCGEIFALVAEYQGPLGVASEEDGLAIRKGGPLVYPTARVEVEGKLVEQYGRRFAGSVWSLINRAARIVQFERGQIWRIQHGTRSQHDINDIAMFLASVAAQLRDGPAKELLDEGKRPHAV